MHFCDILINDQSSNQRPSKCLSSKPNMPRRGVDEDIFPISDEEVFKIIKNLRHNEVLIE